jgi:hypothetical protein
MFNLTPMIDSLIRTASPSPVSMQPRRWTSTVEEQRCSYTSTSQVSPSTTSRWR